MNSDAFDEIRDGILNQLIFLMGVVSAPVAVFSVYRYSQMGWRNVFLVHLIIVPIVFVASAFRRSLPYRFKVVVMILLFYVISLLGFVNFPISGHGVSFLLICVLVAVVFLPRIWTAVVVVIAATTIAVIGYLSVNQVIDPMVDVEMLSTFYSGWSNTVSSFLLLMVAVVLIVGNIGQLLNKKLMELSRVNADLKKASEEIRTLKGIVPICSSCNSIRDNEGHWHRVDVYVRDHTHAEFSHGICPICLEKLYPSNSELNSNE